MGKGGSNNQPRCLGKSVRIRIRIPEIMWHTSTRHFFLRAPSRFFETIFSWNSYYFAICYKWGVLQAFYFIFQNASIEQRSITKMEFPQSSFVDFVLLICVFQLINFGLHNVKRGKTFCKKKKLQIFELIFVCVHSQFERNFLRKSNDIPVHWCHYTEIVEP